MSLAPKQTDAEPPFECSDWLSVVSMVTYLLYIIVWDCGLFIGAAWLVYWKGASEWLFVLALIGGSLAYKPKSWRQLWMRETDNRRMGDSPDGLQDSSPHSLVIPPKGGE